MKTRTEINREANQRLAAVVSGMAAKGRSWIEAEGRRLAAILPQCSPMDGGTAASIEGRLCLLRKAWRAAA